jgi:hypothetical protein
MSRGNVKENDLFSEVKARVQTPALGGETAERKRPRNARQGERSGGRKRENRESYLSLLFLPSTQKPAQPSAPPRSLGGASKPGRKNSAQAGAVPALLARAWLRQGRGRYGGNQRVSPVRMGSGVAKLAAGGKAFLPRNGRRETGKGGAERTRKAKAIREQAWREKMKWYVSPAMDG